MGHEDQKGRGQPGEAELSHDPPHLEGLRGPFVPTLPLPLTVCLFPGVLVPQLPGLLT